MTEPFEWPQEVIDDLNDLGVEGSTICGEHKPDAKVRALGGCLRPLDDPHDRYKCTDCKVTFHRACAREHFRTSGDATEALRERVMKIIEVCQRNKLALTVDDILGWIFRAASK